MKNLIFAVLFFLIALSGGDSAELPADGLNELAQNGIFFLVEMATQKPTREVVPGSPVSIKVLFKDSPNMLFLDEECQALKVVFPNDLVGEPLYCWGDRIDVIVPPGLQVGTRVQISVNINGPQGRPISADVVSHSPRIIVINDSENLGWVTHPDGSAVTHDKPAKPGETVIVRVVGLGKPLQFVLAEIAGRSVDVIERTGRSQNDWYAGRSLDQVSLIIPLGLPADRLNRPLVIFSGPKGEEKPSNMVSLPVWP